MQCFVYNFLLYQQCKYNIKILKLGCVFSLALVFILTKSMSEPRCYQNCSLMLNWSVTKNVFSKKGAAI